MFRPMALDRHLRPDRVAPPVADARAGAVLLLPEARDSRSGRPGCLRAAHRAYAPMLRWSLAHPRPTAWLAAGIFAVSLGAAAFLGAEFVPHLDEGDIVVLASRLPSVSLTETLAATTAIEKVLLRFPRGAHGGLQVGNHRGGGRRHGTRPVGRVHHAEAAPGMAGRHDARSTRGRDARGAGAGSTGQRLRLLPADRGALQRADRGRTERPGGQGVRGRPGGARAQGQRDGGHPGASARSSGRARRGHVRAAAAAGTGGSGADRTPRHERGRRAVGGRGRAQRQDRGQRVRRPEALRHRRPARGRHGGGPGRPGGGGGGDAWRTARPPGPGRTHLRRGGPGSRSAAKRRCDA